MTYADKLREWCQNEKAKGLVSINFFPGRTKILSLEDACKNVYESLTGESIDITNEIL